MNVIDRANRVRWWTAGSMIAIVVALVTVSIATIAVTGRRSSIDAADDIVARIGRRTVDLVSSELDDAIESVNLITAMLDDEMLAERDTDLDRLLSAQLVAVSQLSGAFVGFPDGSFRFARRTDDGLVLKHIETTPTRVVTEAPVDDGLRPGRAVEIIDDTYDPVERPWYQQATASTEPVWTNPYVFFSSGQPGVTAARAIRSAGTVIAVVGVDVALERLSEFLDDLPIDSSAEAFLLADDRLVAAPTTYPTTRTDDAGNVVLPTLDSVGLDPVIVSRFDSTQRPQATDAGGRIFRAGLSGSNMPSWSVVVRTHRIEFVEAVRRQSNLALTATALSGLLLLAAIALFVNWLRRPIGELSDRARLDPLTGLANRGSLLEDGERLLEATRRGDRELVVAILDIDDFKMVNDDHGHATGDAALVRLSEGLRLSARPDDIIGRLGGDEFVVLLPDVDRVEAEAILERLQLHAETSLRSEAATSSSTVTIGVSSRSGRSLDLDRLIDEADAQLLASKRLGRGQIRWMDEPVLALT